MTPSRGPVVQAEVGELRYAPREDVGLEGHYQPCACPQERADTRGEVGEHQHTSLVQTIPRLPQQNLPTGVGRPPRTGVPAPVAAPGGAGSAQSWWERPEMGFPSCSPTSPSSRGVSEWDQAPPK
ncbi:hypothetical protein NDU88_000714 [Pleurodeles waltl]|uniref:Uncharacterized protein n=1 Tax=Pleurodeles waltl TaxID=8319 RepID=A0AAV7P1L3_PLEWA|nr:hypothetical protein NDU88_000714 [Pleurodeles waltl]